MRIVTAALVALAASPAAADTAVSTSAACEVRFVRAPDDARHVIEAWLAAEPRCTSINGLRGELDVIRRGAWTLGAALSRSTAGYRVNEVASYATEDYKAVAYVARTSLFRAWQLRIAAGAGVLSTGAHITRDEYGTDGSYLASGDTSLVGEASISASIQLSSNWSVSGGPILSVMSQDLVYFNPRSWEPMENNMTRRAELMFAGGLRYAL